MSRVVLDNVTKWFTDQRGARILALDRVALTVEPGQLLVLVGPSGSGKTTLLRLIAGLDEISEGNILVDGENLKDLPPRRREVAMVFQKDALFPHLTVGENLGFGLKLRKFSRTEIERRVGAAAEMLELRGCLERHPHELSAGERQRVALGRALVRQPKVFLLDEPLSSLDGPLRMQMRAEIARLHQRLQATMIYVTHDQAEAMTLGERIAVLNAGALQQIDTPLRIYQQPVNVFVAGFMGAPPINLVRGRLLANGSGIMFEAIAAANAADPGAKLRVHMGTPPAHRLTQYVGKEIVLGIRPEHITVARGGATGSGEKVEATVQVLETTGAETFVHASAGAHSLLVRTDAASAPSLRQKIGLEFDMSRAHFFDPLTQARLG